LTEHTEVRELKPGLVPFPAATDIFVADQPWLAEHLLPLISIDLGLLRPELAGTVVHMLCPVEPFDGHLGAGTETCHNAFTAPNWFALELTPDNRYRFLGHEGFFQRAPEHGGRFTREACACEHTDGMLLSYDKARAYFAEHGRMARYARRGRGEPMEQDYLDRLGGGIWYGNWTDHPPIPPAFRLQTLPDAGMDEQEDDGIRITRDGRPFFHVADVAGYNWCATGADSILLFYEPESRTVLFTFEWT
jgi:hypothetical protein